VRFEDQEKVWAPRELVEEERDPIASSAYSFLEEFGKPQISNAART
jgi:hypothetical protein